MVGTKVLVKYELETKPLIVKPGDKLKGKVTIMNGEKKDKKLKGVFIEMYDIYQQFITRTDTEGNESSSWTPMKKELKQWDLVKKGGDKIKSGETLEFPFEIELPNWEKKKGKGKEDDTYNEWHLELHFNQKTAMVASRGADKKEATCILPAKGTMLHPNFGDPKKYSKEKKAEKQAKKNEK